MKTIGTLLLVAMAAHAADKSAPDVVVLLHAGNAGPAVIGPAERLAERILESAGVSVAWRVPSPSDRYRAEVIEVIEAVLTIERDNTVQPGALAHALLGPQSGTRIEIFYNRVRGSMRESEISPVLAHVLVHEITHILEGVNRHSESGIMKAHWDPEDRRRMRYSPLPFNPDDIGLIQAWTANRNRTLFAGLQ